MSGIGDIAVIFPRQIVQRAVKRRSRLSTNQINASRQLQAIADERLRPYQRARYAPFAPRNSLDEYADRIGAV